MRKLFIGLAVALFGLMFIGTASAGDYGHGRYYDRGHYHYHPGHFERHRNHYHYVPGHFDYHRGPDYVPSYRGYTDYSPSYRSYDRGIYVPSYRGSYYRPGCGY
jgi:hypothetical protein